MEDTSARLKLPYIQPAQAQKHVTHNEAIADLDVLVQLVIEEFDATSPPANAAEGQNWALGASPEGAWEGYPFHIATYQRSGSWRYKLTQPGWTAVSASDHAVYTWTGSVWRVSAEPDLSQVAGLGIGTGFDATNALAVASVASLFTHTGSGGHQLKLNKSQAGDTASLLFQTDWSGRAEMGTTGSDNFEIKVSSDGANWFTGARFDAGTGMLAAPNGIRIDGALTGSAVQETPIDATTGRVLQTGAFGLGARGDAPNIENLDAFDTPVGFYRYTDGTQNIASLPNGAGSWGVVLVMRLDADEPTQQLTDLATGQTWSRRIVGGLWQDWRKTWDSQNTTVDTNGFLKAASPILRLNAQGVDEPVEPVRAVFSRISAGIYSVSDVEPLASQGWQIEVPQDHNGNRSVFVETDYDGDARTLSVTTQKVVWDATTGRWTGGDFVDIPDGQWVDLRLSPRS